MAVQCSRSRNRPWRQDQVVLRARGITLGRDMWLWVLELPSWPPAGEAAPLLGEGALPQPWFLSMSTLFWEKQPTKPESPSWRCTSHLIHQRRSGKSGCYQVGEVIWRDFAFRSALMSLKWCSQSAEPLSLPLSWASQAGAVVSRRAGSRWAALGTVMVVPWAHPSLCSMSRLELPRSFCDAPCTLLKQCNQSW